MTHEQRVKRACDLAAKYPFAAELLGFHAHIAMLQGAIFEALKNIHAAPRTEALKSETIPDVARNILLWFAPGMADLVRNQAPAALKEAAESIDAALLLERYWASRETESAHERFFALALLQPYAEALAENASAPGTGATCPLCGAEPIAAVLRPEGYGARRSLACSLCAHEWHFARAICPSCGESRPEALGVYTTEQFEHVRVEACDTCKRYVKTIDLSKDGLAIPVVDEIAAVPLDLWAGEHGYEKLCPNLLNL